MDATGKVCRVDSLRNNANFATCRYYFKMTARTSDNTWYPFGMQEEYENWAKSAAPYFQQALGLQARFAVGAARLYIALWAAGLSPRISSGFRDPAKQREMQARWDAGDRAGLRVRPATNSSHSATTFLGAPASTAIDMPSSDEKRAADIAKSLGIGTGLTFGTPDPGHYYLLGGA